MHESKMGSFFRASHRTWSGKGGSNSRPIPWQGIALPAELFPHYKHGSLTNNPKESIFPIEGKGTSNLVNSLKTYLTQILGIYSSLPTSCGKAFFR